MKRILMRILMRILRWTDSVIELIWVADDEMRRNVAKMKTCIECECPYDPDERVRVYGEHLTVIGSGCCSAQCYTQEMMKEKEGKA